MGCLLKFVMVGVFMLLAKVSSRSSKLSNLKDGAIVACKDIERNIVSNEDFQKDMSKANIWSDIIELSKTSRKGEAAICEDAEGDVKSAELLKAAD